MGFYSERVEFGSPFFETTLNYLPALTKQHDYLLTNINVYQSQPNISFQDPSLMKAGEIGFQLDAYYNIKKETRVRASCTKPSKARRPPAPTMSHNSFRILLGSSLHARPPAPTIYSGIRGEGD